MGRLRGAGLLADRLSGLQAKCRHWVAKPPEVNGTSTPGCRGSEECHPQREGNSCLRGRRAHCADSPQWLLKARRKLLPRPGKAVWAPTP